jgi:predicted deacylase
MSRIAPTVDLDAPGRSVGHLLVPFSDDDHAYSTIPVPVAVLRGGPGPTVLVAAGTHGDEWEGQVIARRIVASVQIDQLQGTIIVLPAHNLPAVRSARRCSPVDGDNLNRAFPGDPDGAPTRMIADYVEKILLPRCDFAMDLHSGGGATEYLPCAFLRIDGDQGRTAAKIAAATALGLPHTFVVAAAGEDRTLSAAADRQGVVMVATELGGGGRIDLGVLKGATAAVGRLLAYWGLLASDPAPVEVGVPTQFLHLGSGPNVVDTHGILEPLVRLGDEVAAGQVVGRVYHLEDLGAAAEEIHAAAEGVIAIIRTRPLVRPGDFASSVGSPVSPEAIPVLGGDEPSVNSHQEKGSPRGPGPQ